ncbi:16S rRNA (guanine(527)-N(7))-methyltransferase RsmG [Candidatus Dependentiae bacterium]|nr:16S rRNA (guanine(527)-N(7))-methyltransferase RsmG [Candidatus Dependentiae bacterium]MCC7414714.1 16S rRNA (guanine(527)-N(7))-methyltransferase RsmG [Campylobacterota bacterium]
MHNTSIQTTSAEPLWTAFAADQQVSPEQLALFKQYYEMLMDWNERMNLTAITELEGVLYDHFRDALSVLATGSIKSSMTICDVGSGCGVPGIPIAIMRPDIRVVLLEVNQKKLSFLRAVVAALNLSHVLVCDMDWLMFIHQAPMQVDVFCARASLKPEDLVRIFHGPCAYRSSLLIYWASKLWMPGEKEKPFYTIDNWYTLRDKERRLAFFKDLTYKKRAPRGS